MKVALKILLVRYKEKVCYSDTLSLSPSQLALAQTQVAQAGEIYNIEGSRLTLRKIAI